MSSSHSAPHTMKRFVVLFGMAFTINPQYSSSESVQGDLVLRMQGGELDDEAMVTDFRFVVSRPTSERHFSIEITLRNRRRKPETFCIIGRKQDAADDSFHVTAAIEGKMQAIKLLMELSVLQILMACRLYAVNHQPLSEHFGCIALAWYSHTSVEDSRELTGMLELMSV